MIRSFSLITIVALAVVAFSAPASACPSCQVAVQQPDGLGANGAGRGNPARAYYFSIVAMLGLLSLVGGGLIRLMVKVSREVPAPPPATTAGDTIDTPPRR